MTTVVEPPLRTTAPSPPAQPLPAGRTGLRLARAVVGLVALLAVWLVLFGTVLSGLQEHRAQATRFATFREQLAGQDKAAPLAEPITRGSPVALLSAPRLGLRQAVIVEGTSSHDLMSGPGHLPSSVLPGQVGTSVVFGRATTFGGPFRHVPSLRLGDPLRVVTAQGSFTYHVERVRHGGDSYFAPKAGDGRLTLVTATGAGWRAAWGANTTVYVDAVLHKAAPAGQVAVDGSADDRPLQGESQALTSLVFALEGLLLLALAAVWAARRWTLRQTWLISTGGLLALLWISSEAAWRLLPNLL